MWSYCLYCWSCNSYQNCLNPWIAFIFTSHLCGVMFAWSSVLYVKCLLFRSTWLQNGDLYFWLCHSSTLFYAGRGSVSRCLQHWDKWPVKLYRELMTLKKIYKEKSSSLYSSTKVCCNSKSPLTLCKIKTDKETNKQKTIQRMYKET